MKTYLVLATTIALMAVNSSSALNFNLKPKPSPAALATQTQPLTRRATLNSLFTATTTAAALLLLDPAPAAADNSIFADKTYTDPVNHPGGTRTIELTNTSFAGYTLAKVRGGGGKGEPESYELPAMVFNCPGNASNYNGNKNCITIDFSPKGGPKDFQGYWDDERKGIRFILDDNFWPATTK